MLQRATLRFIAILHLHMSSIPKKTSGIMIALTTFQRGMLSDGNCKLRSLLAVLNGRFGQQARV